MANDLGPDYIDSLFRERRRRRRVAANIAIVLGALIAVAMFGLANNPSVPVLWQSVCLWSGVILVIAIAFVASVTYFPKGMSPAQYFSFWNWWS
jgi:drug/metabolite transporter (DMT)-like permease